MVLVVQLTAGFLHSRVATVGHSLFIHTEAVLPRGREELMCLQRGRPWRERAMGVAAAACRVLLSGCLDAPESGAGDRAPHAAPLSSVVPGQRRGGHSWSGRHSCPRGQAGCPPRPEGSLTPGQSAEKGGQCLTCWLLPRLGQTSALLGVDGSPSS